MGIPGLFKQIVHKYKGIYTYKKELEYDDLDIDFNSFIYEAFAHVVQQFRETQKRNPHVKWSIAYIEKLIIAKVITLTTHLICTVVKPTKQVYIAIDGPAPRAKMVQQRARRYKKVMERAFKRRITRDHGTDLTDIWDTSKISPGTPFMAALSKALQAACKSNQFSQHTMTGPGCSGKPIRIILSDGTVPGEGEHKFNESLTERGGNVCIYSNDGDLIILANRFTGDKASKAKSKNITILRTITTHDPLYDPVLKHPFAFLYVKKYQDAMIEEMELNVYDADRVMYDFVFMSFFGGNDFVHAFPFTEMRDRYTLGNLLQIYKDLLYKFNGEFNLQPAPTVAHTVTSKGTKTQPKALAQPKGTKAKSELNAVYLISMDGDEPILHHEFFKAFMNELGKRESGSLRKKFERIVKYNPRSDGESEPDPGKRALLQYEHRYYYDQDNPFYHIYHNEFYKIDYTLEKRVWKQQYYKHFFGINALPTKRYNYMVTQECKHYIESLLFTMKYYLKELPSWTWYNRARVAPIPSDVAWALKYIPDVNSLGDFGPSTSYTPQEQLMLILPSSNRILPKAVNGLMRRPDLAPYYPRDFQLDVVAGSKHIYSDPILPDIDVEAVVNAYNSLDLKSPLNTLNTHPQIFN